MSPDLNIVSHVIDMQIKVLLSIVTPRSNTENYLCVLSNLYEFSALLYYVIAKILAWVQLLSGM